MTAVEHGSSAARSRKDRTRIIAIGAGLYALSGPGQTAGFSVFVDPVIESLDISRGQLTAGYLVATLLAAPSGMWLGRQIDNRDVAQVIRFIGIGLAGALCIAASAPALWVLIVGVLGLRIFGQTGFTLTPSVYVARMISERRGAALGALIAAGGASISLTPLGASRITSHLGWRQTWFLLAAFVVVAAHLLAMAASRSAPPRSPGPIEDDESLVLADAVVDSPRHFGFAVVTAGFATIAGIGTALGFHQIAILEERGLTASAAAANFLPQSLAAAAIALTVGRVVDRVNGRWVIPSCMTLLTGALFSLHMVGSSATALVYGMMLGSAGAAVGASEGTLLARWLGTDQLGRVRGRLMLAIVTASAIGPLAFTVLADAVGSYTNAASVASALPLAVGLGAAIAPLPAHHPEARID